MPIQMSIDYKILDDKEDEDDNGNVKYDDDDDDEYDYIAIIKNKTAYNDFVENIDDTDREFDKVTQIHFGENFNYPIDDLPSQITTIKIYKSFSYRHTIPETVIKVIVKNK
jgi:hypothetical protein